jgi:hypothetical protein
MSDFFRIYRGLELDEAAQFLTGTGAPGTGGDTAAAPRGSYFTDTGNGELWMKTGTGTGTDKWSRMATQDYVTTVSSSGLSWREPVAVRDNTSATVADIKADIDADDLIQGVAVTVGMRILGSNVTGNKNIFIVSGATGNWTLTEDLNLETAGDTTYVTNGTDAGKSFQYDSAGNWIWINSDDQAELGFVRTFVGKTGPGAETPTYSSTVIVSNGDNLETGIGKLDAETAYQNTFMGKAVGSDAPNYSSNNVVTDTSSLEAAIGDLDAEIGAAVTNGTVVLAANAVNANVQALDGEVGFIDAFIGKAAGNEMPNYSSNGYVADGDSIETAIGKLDAAVGASSLQTSSTNVTAITTIDSILGVVAEWDVYVQEAATPTKVRAYKVFAVHNGTAPDHTTFATLAIGSGITGLALSVTLSGGNTLNLRVASTAAVNVKAQRLAAIV